MKECSCKAFPTKMGILRAFRRVISIKGVSMIYKMFFEHNESHYVFTSVFESIIFILVLLDLVSECLLERKIGH